MSAEPHQPETLYAGKFLSLVKLNQWEFATRHNASGVVAIVAVTQVEELLIVEQYRAPLDKNCLELPAGLAGDEPGMQGETFQAAAQRELLEETGYAGGQWSYAGQYASSAGLTDECIDFFIARNVMKQSVGGGVAGEAITLHIVPMISLYPWLTQQQQAGKAVDAKLLAGLALYQQEKKP